MEFLFSIDGGIKKYFTPDNFSCEKTNTCTEDCGQGYWLDTTE